MTSMMTMTMPTLMTTTMRTNSLTKIRYVAVRMGDCIELRKYARPPEVIRSKLIMPNGFVMKQVWYEGGKVLHCCSYQRWWRATKQSIGVDKMITIKDPLLSLVKSTKWRGYNL